MVNEVVPNESTPGGADQQAIAKAAKVIASGGVAAFPTETVYGLGADATNPTAIARIYQAKGRPGDNPLILHIADQADFAKLTTDVPPYAQALMQAFWPGPLTLVAKKKPGLPPWLGGHPSGEASTIGIRMPSHPMALAVIKASGCFVAAPSANKAGTPSPTRAEHVARDFADGSIDFVLDGGAVDCGVESTVVDITGDLPVILRPGAVTPMMIEGVTSLKAMLGFGDVSSIAPEGVAGEVEVGAAKVIAPDDSNPSAESNDSKSKLAQTKPFSEAQLPPPLSAESKTTPPRSPGMKYRHYAPKAPMTLVVGDEAAVAAYIYSETAKERANNRKVGILVTEQTMAALEDIEAQEGIPSQQAHPNTQHAQQAQSADDDKSVTLSVLSEMSTSQVKRVKAAFTKSSTQDFCTPDTTTKPAYSLILGDKSAPETIARNLYASLRQFDIAGVDIIFAEGLPNEGLGLAIMDRMKKAAEGRVVHV